MNQQEFSHEEADVDPIRELEENQFCKEARGDRRLMLNQTFNLVRRMRKSESRFLAMSALKGIFIASKEDEAHSERLLGDFLVVLQGLSSVPSRN